MKIAARACPGAGCLAQRCPDGIGHWCPECHLVTLPYPNGTVRRHNRLRSTPVPLTRIVERLTTLHRDMGTIRSLLDRIQITRTPDHDAQDRTVGEWQVQITLALADLQGLTDSRNRE